MAAMCDLPGVISKEAVQESIPSVNVTICFDYTSDRLPTHTSELCQKLIIMLL